MDKEKVSVENKENKSQEAPYINGLWWDHSSDDEITEEGTCDVCLAYAKIVDDIARITRQKRPDAEKIIAIKTIVLRKYMNITCPLYDCYPVKRKRQVPSRVASAS